MNRVIVVGGGLAGVRSVEALRAKGFEGEVTLISAESHPPYDRPPLSKAVLMGDRDETTIDADWERLRCEPMLGVRATALEPGTDGGGGVVRTTAGDLPFDGLVIATGSAPIRLPGEGPQRVMRTIDDARELRAGLREGAAVAIVGAGWIGAEVATAAAAKGCRVTVVEAADAPLAGALGAEVGARTARWYTEAGVELRTGVKVGSVDPGGLTLADGDRIGADEVVVGIGVRPDLGWLAGSGLDLDEGVVVDGSMRTSRQGVVAVGDCAAWWSARYERRLCVEHWDTALNAPDVAAATLLGQEAVYDAVPYFWSDQFGRMVQYAGHHAGSRRLLFRGDPDGAKWAACWLTDDRLDAIATVASPRDMAQARRIITAGTPVDVDLLADPAVAIRDAVKG